MRREGEWKVMQLIPASVVHEVEKRRSLGQSSLRLTRIAARGG